MARPRLKDQGTPARDRIIAAAEYLFADRGVDLTSYREIARAAEVNSNLVSYHFPEKTDLFLTVVKLRADVINDDRMELLTSIEYRSAPTPPPVEEIAYSFVHPVFEFMRREPGVWSRHGRAILHAHGSPLYKEAIMGIMSRIMKSYAGALQRSLPKATKADVLYLLELMFVMNFLSSESSTQDLFDSELHSQREPAELEQRMIRSFAGAARAFG